MLATLKLISEKFDGAEGYVTDKCGLSKDEVERIRSHLIVKGGAADQEQ